MSEHTIPLPAGSGARSLRKFTLLPPEPPEEAPSFQSRRPSFWKERCFEGGMILSIFFYYIFCNKNLSFSILSHQNPLWSLPFLLLFAVLSWYRLPFALALLPLTLPYYNTGFQKVVEGRIEFSLVEITLWTCVVVAALRFLVCREDRQRWRALPARLGPLLWPALLFLLMAAISLLVSYPPHRGDSIRVFREEVVGPLLYLALVLVYLRTKEDLTRLLVAFLGTGVIIALLGMAQYLFFILPIDSEGSRVHTVYGSGNNIGTLFDYILPVALALLLSRLSWKYRSVGLGISVLMVPVLYWSQSRGAWLAIICAFLFILMLAIRNRRAVFTMGGILIVAILVILIPFHNQMFKLLDQGHTSKQGYGTLTKRIYLWETAWPMIADHPWFGVGLDNWLCYYSKNSECNAKVFHYWVLKDPQTHRPTGLQEEPTLSHPHNIFLHVWVSIGIFGLLAFVGILILFYWLFARILARIRRTGGHDAEYLQWILISVGSALLAAFIQGQVDSTFLEQDLAFCFWGMVAALLVLRAIVHVPWWRERITGVK